MQNNDQAQDEYEFDEQEFYEYMDFDTPVEEEEEETKSREGDTVVPLPELCLYEDCVEHSKKTNDGNPQQGGVTDPNRPSVPASMVSIWNNPPRAIPHTITYKLELVAPTATYKLELVTPVPGSDCPQCLAGKLGHSTGLTFSCNLCSHSDNASFSIRT